MKLQMSYSETINQKNNSLSKKKLFVRKGQLISFKINNAHPNLK